ncbi:hypothetical protein [Williamsia sterculiae]|uniref:Uncharacterized protein n=1 Tax=Williamsia sterculiae TaxID=1344003 RepID=A0A1N7GGA6_9NOCA|nr:hypothetical protein [Williamsia sterculiae]SIS11546.1 hypothetical protein SAMN05445060_2744 [Williamsia sterculiae]
MTAGIYNLTIEQGTTARFKFRWTDDGNQPVDLTGATCRMQLRRSKSLTSALLSDVTQYLTAVPLDGSVYLEIPDTVTLNYTFSSAHYSLRVDRPGDKKRLIEGVVVISAETTA